MNSIYEITVMHTVTIVLQLEMASQYLEELKDRYEKTTLYFYTLEHMYKRLRDDKHKHVATLNVRDWYLILVNLFLSKLLFGMFCCDCRHLRMP